MCRYVWECGGWQRGGAAIANLHKQVSKQRKKATVTKTTTYSAHKELISRSLGLSVAVSFGIVYKTRLHTLNVHGNRVHTNIEDTYAIHMTIRYKSYVLGTGMGCYIYATTDNNTTLDTLCNKWIQTSDELLDNGGAIAIGMGMVGEKKTRMGRWAKENVIPIK